MKVYVINVIYNHLYPISHHPLPSMCRSWMSLTAWEHDSWSKHSCMAEWWTNIMGSMSGRLLDSSTGSLAPHSALEMILGHGPDNDDVSVGQEYVGQYIPAQPWCTWSGFFIGWQESAAARVDNSTMMYGCIMTVTQCQYLQQQPVGEQFWLGTA